MIELRNWSPKFKKELRKLLGKPHRVKQVGKWKIEHWKVNGLSIVWENDDNIHVTDLVVREFLYDEDEILRRIKGKKKK